MTGDGDALQGTGSTTLRHRKLVRAPMPELENWRTGGPPIDHLHVRIGMLIDFVTSRLDARMPEKIVWESTEDSPSGAFKLPPVAHALCCSIHMSVK